MIEITLIILGAMTLSFIEGIREYHFYNINKAAVFQLPSDDKFVKWINAGIAVTLHVVILSLFGYLWLIPATLAVRLILLDGTLNVARGITFFAVGTRDPFKILKGWEATGKILIVAISIVVSIIIHNLIN